MELCGELPIPIREAIGPARQYLADARRFRVDRSQEIVVEPIFSDNWLEHPQGFLVLDGHVIAAAMREAPDQSNSSRYRCKVEKEKGASQQDAGLIAGIGFETVIPSGCLWLGELGE